MLKVEGLLVGVGVREGEERQGYNGSYKTADRFVVSVASGDLNELPQYHNCESKAVMDNIARNCTFGQRVELTGRPGAYGRLLITGVVLAPVARTA